MGKILASEEALEPFIRLEELANIALYLFERNQINAIGRSTYGEGRVLSPYFGVRDDIYVFSDLDLVTVTAQEHEGLAEDFRAMIKEKTSREFSLRREFMPFDAVSGIEQFMARELFGPYVSPQDPVLYGSGRLLSPSFGIINGDGFSHIHIFPYINHIRVTDENYLHGAEALQTLFEKQLGSSFDIREDFDSKRNTDWD